MSSVGESKNACPGFYALGIGGQVLYVNPSKKLIMVRVGMNNYNSIFIPLVFEQLSNGDRW